ncbi:hypothetical protein QR680_010624 [Steinernema hermaphroditum]|uniref:Uncharacterized protein n=1 Tax=Steinernema hermaphroditum TaxID=289476 RepID=A0AA39MBI8_9BILA|nr:hypothetical protein QR680_010624 [Steinernema hermaphroditum]
MKSFTTSPASPTESADQKANRKSQKPRLRRTNISPVPLVSRPQANTSPSEGGAEAIRDNSPIADELFAFLAEVEKKTNDSKFVIRRNPTRPAPVRAPRRTKERLPSPVRITQRQSSRRFEDRHRRFTLTNDRHPPSPSGSRSDHHRRSSRHHENLKTPNSNATPPYFRTAKFRQRRSPPLEPPLKVIDRQNDPTTEDAPYRFNYGPEGREDDERNHERYAIGTKDAVGVPQRAR